MSTAKLPVSICIGVYNEDKFLNTTIQSCILQNVKEIIISDNCSTDNTYNICQKYIYTNNNIKYYRHDINYGALYNRKFAINSATQEYCIIIGGHDFFIHDNHVNKLYNLCISDENVAGAYCGADHYSVNYEFMRRYDYPYSKLLKSDREHIRIKALVSYLSDGTIYYGLYKTLNTQRILNSIKRPSCDFIFVGNQALLGKMLHEPSIHLARIDPRSDVESREKRHNRFKKIYNSSRPYHVIVHQVLSFIDSLQFSPSYTADLKAIYLKRREKLLAMEK